MGRPLKTGNIRLWSFYHLILISTSCSLTKQCEKCSQLKKKKSFSSSCIFLSVRQKYLFLYKNTRVCTSLLQWYKSRHQVGTCRSASDMRMMLVRSCFSCSARFHHGAAVLEESTISASIITESLAIQAVPPSTMLTSKWVQKVKDEHFIVAMTEISPDFEQMNLPYPCEMEPMSLCRVRA